MNRATGKCREILVSGMKRFFFASKNAICQGGHLLQGHQTLCENNIDVETKKNLSIQSKEDFGGGPFVSTSMIGTLLTYNNVPRR